MPQDDKKNAAASEINADAMPPTPTPTPTPKRRGERASAPDRPDDVTEQTWVDWIGLRKAKHAPVTETVLSGARDEARKAAMSLESFLRVWCTRGSQGLQAAWLRSDERATGPPAEPAWRVEQRQRTQLAAPGVAVQNPNFFDLEAADVPSHRLG
jgi:hypothetical protein